ncbi:MAG: hypothetical protein SOW57_05000, partial [Prevotella sp.]|nr:hypothetical protein [Prevotella sp.]
TCWEYIKEDFTKSYAIFVIQIGIHFFSWFLGVVGFWLFFLESNGKSRWHSGGVLGVLVVGYWFWVIGFGLGVRMLIEDLTVYLSKIPKTYNLQPTTYNQQPTTTYIYYIFTLFI